MKSCYRIMLGSRSINAEEVHKGKFIGVGWFKKKDLTNKFS